MNIIRFFILVSRWRLAKWSVTGFALAFICMGCGQDQKRPEIVLTAEQVGESVTVLMSNNSPKPLTINRLFVPGYPDSSIEYLMVTREVRTAEPGRSAGSSHIIDPASLPLRLDPGSFYGYRIDVEDIRSYLGFKDRCVSVAINYRNRRPESLYSEISAVSPEFRICAKPD